MKKIYLVIMMLFLTEIVSSQPQFHNIHYLGFQRTKFTMDNQGATGSSKFGNISFSGLAINDKAVFHLDMSYLVNALLKFDNLQGGVFEFGAGLPFASKENSRWGWSFDVMFRKMRTEKFKYDSLSSPEFKEVNFAGIGGSIYYVRTIADFFYISPKLSISYGGVNIAGIENRKDFMTDMAISIGCPISNGWGLSSTFGIYGSNWENDNETRTEFTMGYIRIGLAYLWKK
jgi:hypothetical protein